ELPLERHAERLLRREEEHRRRLAESPGEVGPHGDRVVAQDAVDALRVRARDAALGPELELTAADPAEVGAKALAQQDERCLALERRVCGDVRRDHETELGGFPRAELRAGVLPPRDERR